MDQVLLLFGHCKESVCHVSNLESVQLVNGLQPCSTVTFPKNQLYFEHDDNFNLQIQKMSREKTPRFDFYAQIKKKKSFKGANR